MISLFRLKMMGAVPLALHHFAQIVARYPLKGTGEKLRAQMRESTRQAEMLFQGLLYESFGEQESASHHV